MIWPLDFWVIYLFRNRKSRSIQKSLNQPDQEPFEVGGHWKATSGPTMAVASKSAFGAINSPKHTPEQGNTHFSETCLLPHYSLRFFSLPNTKKHSKKYIKVSWFFSLHQEHKILIFYLIFLSLILHFGFGV